MKMCTRLRLNLKTRDYNITWAGPTTSNYHIFVGVLSVNGTVVNLQTNENFTAFDDDFFIPQLPSIVISSVSSSVNSTTNDVTTRGQDLVVGDTYKYRIKILDSGNATVAQSALTTVTATYQGNEFRYVELHNANIFRHVLCIG